PVSHCEEEIMSIHTLQNPDQPGPGDPAVDSALRLIGEVVNESPLAKEQFQTARYHAAQARELDKQAQVAGERASQAQARVAAEQLKADPPHRIPPGVGTTLA